MLFLCHILVGLKHIDSITYIVTYYLPSVIDSKKTMNTRVVACLLSWTLLQNCSLSLATTTTHFVIAATDIEDWIIEHRRELHKIPELLFNEEKTSAKIRSVLDGLNIPYVYPVAKTGIVATLGSGASPVVALRSDIDALPILEETGVDFASETPGIMHACGHDAHMSMLLGAARILKERESTLKGTVKLIFQPAEEGGAGGDRMVKEGALDGVDAAFGLHVWPSMRTGMVGTRSGTIMAGSLVFKASFAGVGGHAAIPHITKDPVVAASSAVVSLQSLVGRNISPFESAVVSVTKIWTEEEGSIGAFNVIPHVAHIGGTVRATTDEGMKLVRQRVEDIVINQAKAMGCDGTVDWMEDDHPYYPPVVNDKEASDFVSVVAAKAFGDNMVDAHVEATMAGEDFAFIAQKVPSAFAFLGIRNETAGSTHGLHTSKFTLDESVLKRGAALHAMLASEFLEKNGFGGRQGHSEL